MQGITREKNKKTQDITIEKQWEGDYNGKEDHRRRERQGRTRETTRTRKEEQTKSK